MLELPPILGSGIVADVDSFNFGGARPQLQYYIYSNEEAISFEHPTDTYLSLDSKSFASYLKEKSRSSQVWTNLFFLGFIYLFAGLSVLFAVNQDIQSRRGQMVALHNIGFTKTRILFYLLVERIIFLVYCTAILTVLLFIIYINVQSNANSIVGSGFATFPYF
ncbi:hypothetical protein [Actinotignum urinale]|uniref:hypothetical protein n=1 Tax=Actinotignum urinale TaxID=190146 RepID=UPI00059183C3|nr:hypothetical protein [Actinotignum urinale]